MLVCALDLDVAFVYVVGRLDGVLLGVLDHGLLGLDDLGHVGEHGGEFGEGHLDALELVVAGSYGAEDGCRLAGAVGFQLSRISLFSNTKFIAGIMCLW